MPVLNNGAEPAVAAGGRFRLGPAGIAAVALGAAILAALIVALFIAFQRPATDAATAADSPPSSTATAAGSATADSSAENPGSGASALLAALFDVIEEQRQAGSLDGKTADELTKKLEQVGREVDKGDTGKAAEKLTDLGSKLDELHRDGKITTAGYEAVQASLTQLADTLPPSEEDQSGEDE